MKAQFGITLSFRQTLYCLKPPRATPYLSACNPKRSVPNWKKSSRLCWTSPSLARWSSSSHLHHSRTQLMLWKTPTMSLKVYTSQRLPQWRLFRVTYRVIYFSFFFFVRCRQQFTKSFSRNELAQAWQEDQSSAWCC